jgi:hypothetical protein
LRKMRPTLEQVLSGIQAVTRKEMVSDFVENSCIASTRVVVNVLKHYGYDALPFPCQVYVYNKTFKEHLEAGKKLFQGDALIEWCKLTGAWSVGIGVYDPEKHFRETGHLVALIPGHNILVDASIDQANRPQHGIHLPQVLIAGELTDGFKAGVEDLSLTHNDCLLVYHPTDNDIYKIAPDWLKQGRVNRIVRAVRRQIERNAA